MTNQPQPLPSQCDSCGCEMAPRADAEILKYCEPCNEVFIDAYYDVDDDVPSEDPLDSWEYYYDELPEYEEPNPYHGTYSEE